MLVSPATSFSAADSYEVSVASSWLKLRARIAAINATLSAVIGGVSGWSGARVIVRRVTDKRVRSFENAMIAAHAIITSSSSAFRLIVTDCAACSSAIALQPQFAVIVRSLPLQLAIRTRVFQPLVAPPNDTRLGGPFDGIRLTAAIIPCASV